MLAIEGGLRYWSYHKNFAHGIYEPGDSGCVYFGPRAEFAAQYANFLKHNGYFPTVVVKDPPEEVAKWAEEEGGRGPILLHDPTKPASQRTRMPVLQMPRATAKRQKRA